MSKADLEGEDGDTIEEQSVEEFSRRINMYVAIMLRANPGAARDCYKDGLVYRARKDIIAEFLAATALKRCQHKDCGA